MRKDKVFVAAGLGVALATAGGIWVLSPAGARPNDDNSPTPAPTQQSSTSGAHTSRTQGGTVSVTCQGGRATLVSWSAAPGYRADHVVRGPAAVARLEFESDVADDVTVSVRCAGGVPQVSAVAEFDDHGGLRDRDDRVESGDDRDDRRRPEPGDDNGGLRDRDDRVEPGDDRDARGDRDGHDDGDGDSSGPGRGDSREDSSGPGSGHDEDNSGSGSGHGGDDSGGDDHGGHGSDD